MTMFATAPDEPSMRVPGEPPAKQARLSVPAESNRSKETSTASGKDPCPTSPDAADQPAVMDQPKVVHGPMFRALPEKLKIMIVKLLKNLGHPGVMRIQFPLYGPLAIWPGRTPRSNLESHVGRISR